MISNQERMEAILEDPMILVTDRKISSLQELLPLLEKLVQTGKKELFIVADEIEGEALATLVVNKLRGILNVLAVKTPGFGDRKKEMLQDIATVTGGVLISDDLGIKLESVELGHLGKASKVVSTKDSTVIVGGKGKKADIEKRITQIKVQRNNTTAKYDIEKFDERIAKLSGGVAVVKVGAPTETEMKYLKLKIEDAVNATKAAISEGIVCGGGVALVKASEKIREKILKDKKVNDQFSVGYEIVLNACFEPLRQIAVNCGKGDGSVVIEAVKNGKGNAGYDASKDQMVSDMFLSGIIDPLKVTKTGLLNASSAAAIFLTTEVAITDEPKEDKPDMSMAGGMGY
jgi:chaperonin GroEL